MSECPFHNPDPLSNPNLARACRLLPMGPIFLSQNRKKIFTGIIKHEDRFVKLHDPKNPQGPSHKMNIEEFMTELSHYEDVPFDVGIPVCHLCLLDTATSQPASVLDVHDYERNLSMGLLDFSHRPLDYSDSADDEFDVKFPTVVRAGDSVKVVASGKRRIPCCDNPDCREMADNLPPFKERFWVEVNSVTVFGKITGFTTNALQYCPQLNYSPETPFLAFPMTAVVGVKHGENW